MSEELNLEHIDADGAVRETAAEAIDALDGDTRSQFLRRAGMAGGAVMGGGAVLGALAPSAFGAVSNGDRPPAKFGKGDIGILNFALTLEYLESSFYNEATANRHHKEFLTDSETRVFLQTVTDDENAHVRALQKVLGRHAIKKPTFHFGAATSQEAQFRDLSFAFENEGVAAYSGQAFNIQSPKVLQAALSIVTVEARHAGVIGRIKLNSEKGISPNGAFDKSKGAKHVLGDVHKLNIGL